MRAALTTCLLLVAGSTTACTGGDGPPASPPASPPGPVACSAGVTSCAPVRTDVSRSAFCRAYAALLQIDDGRSVHRWVDAMATVGAPADLSARELRGFELLLAEVATVDEAASSADLLDLSSDLDAAGELAVEAFTEYATTGCTDELQAALSDP